MSQPQWKFLANIGDVNPVDYGGAFIYVDETGVYPPEIAVLVVDELGDDRYIYTEYRYSLDQCKPDCDEWFAPYFGRVEEFIGQEAGSLLEALCSDNIVARAFAYEAMASYHGYENFDGYPLKLTRKEASERFDTKQVV